MKSGTNWKPSPPWDIPMIRSLPISVSTKPSLDKSLKTATPF